MMNVLIKTVITRSTQGLQAHPTKFCHLNVWDELSPRQLIPQNSYNDSGNKLSWCWQRARRV